ncbi:MAG: hypothetical protein AAGG72_10030 [Pseudomonadota bacterium]
MTNTINLEILRSDGFRQIASDEQCVSFCIQAGPPLRNEGCHPVVGEYLIQPSTDPAPVAQKHGLMIFGSENEHLALADGESLFVRGEGTLVVVAQNSDLTGD